MAESREFIKYVAEIAKEKQYAEFSLLLKKWRDLKEMIYILGIPYRATIALQNHKNQDLYHKVNAKQLEDLKISLD